MNSNLFAGVELGGTKSVAVLAEGATILDMVRIPTEHPETTLLALRNQLSLWGETSDIAALGIATFGPVDLDIRSATYGRILPTTKPGWTGADVLGELRQAFAGPIGFDTDVAGAALAEGDWGAAKNADAHAYITIGTGVGGALVCNGRLAHGRAHSEFGHMKVSRNGASGFAGTCPFHGDCVEGLVSGPAIAARAGSPAEELAADHPVWRDVAKDISAFLTALIAIGAPDRILIGGGVAHGKPFLLEMIREEVSRASAGYFTGASREELNLRITAPALGDKAGPLGAIALAQHAAQRSDAARQAA